jgi:hypothetical protein
MPETTMTAEEILEALDRAYEAMRHVYAIRSTNADPFLRGLHNGYMRADEATARLAVASLANSIRMARGDG